ncbi:MAG: dihydroorotate dehydrogenase electron transfer subunit [Chloroflexi bacterium]|nr:dihydroorotate dehydrogenase electron transfer subunit [Chloroflexota bacterium]MCL5110162.1 dihydroorotate dehydrogenase electron transfer subunit [Chloroflexota bacterium]
MIQARFPIVARDELAPGTVLLRLRAPALARAARAGQFVHVRCGDSHDPLLRRPISLHRVGVAGADRGGLQPDEVALLLQVVGRGSAWLAQRRLGDELDVLGPLGRGFRPEPKAGHLLLVGGGLGVAPLVMLADEAVRAGLAVTLAMGTRTAAGVFPARLLPEEVEYAVATEDGSLGQKGLVTDLLPALLPWSDQVFACGPWPMLRALRRLLQLTPAKRAQVSLEERMGCGVGVCYGCVVETRHGRRRVCHDGPVFNLDDVVL